jgi:type VI secretion system protein ImpL
VFWILGGLIVLIVWALWLVLGWPLWVPIASSGAVLVSLIGIWIARKLLARRSAGQLEKAIAAQANQQALNARPERRAEIQELQRQLQQGMAALKTSKLGRGKQSGAAALYSLPWYVIIGPPGAGKTTALRASGLVFPYQNAQGGGVRGVGGTRNCDWWFTNEAILLDTAGRYTTEQDDRDEWISFLQFLLKYRGRRPINGVLVAISITDLIDANEQQIEERAKKVRARIDEVMTQLRMVVPVYVLFTKIDLVAGFAEFFNDLRKSDRAQAWGATLRLDLPKTEPGKIFEHEFDTLTKSLHGRALKRTVQERSREARERIFQFPLEFAGLKRNLAEFLAIAFQPNAFQGTPILRGFYFASGTQEGRPLDRVLGRMSQAMGIRNQEQEAQPPVESKSYFLHDVFMNVVFPDAAVASRTAGEVRRQAIMRFAISGAAFALAAILSIPGITSFLNNRDLLEQTQERAKLADSVDWSDNKPAVDKIKALDPLLDRLKELDKHRDEGVPFGMGWLMYSGDRVYRPAITVYVANLQSGFVVPAKTKLEERLKRADGDKYLQDRNMLKLYLMLGDKEHLDPEWATSRYVSLWAQLLRSTTTVSEIELKRALRPHVAYYFDLVQKGKVVPLQTDPALVEQVRKTLQGVSVRKRYYEMFIESLNDEKYDEEGDDTRENRRFPPISLSSIFSDKPKVLESYYSARFDREKKWQEVEGPYTDKGHYMVINNVADGEKLLQREGWVVPLTRDEQGDQVPRNMKVLVEDYETRYEMQWMDFLKDVRVRNPTSLKEGIKLYNEVVQPPWPLLRLLRQVEDHVMWKNPNPMSQNAAVGNVVNRELNAAASSKLYGLRLGLDVTKIGERTSVLPLKFKPMVDFGVPPERRPGTDDKRGGVTPLDRYIERIEVLKRKATEIDDASQGQGDWRQMKDDLDDARKFITTLLPADGRAREVLTPLLFAPLDYQARPTLGAAGQQLQKVPPGQQPPKPSTGGWPLPGGR